MELKRSGSQPSGRGPEEYFTGSVRIDPLMQTAEPARVSCALVTFEPGRVFDRVVGLEGVPDGYRAMNEREALKVMVEP